MVDWRAVAERVFKEESARILAGLIRVCRSFDWAEEAIQDAFTRALVEWPAKGVPNSPGAWIMAVAQRRIVDRARRETTRTEYQEALAAYLEQRAAVHEDREQEPMHGYPDDRLRLMFTCCHPALAFEARVALTLRTLAGLTTAEIARAFLVSDEAMTKRLVRAKRKIRTAGIPFRVPPAHLLAELLPEPEAIGLLALMLLHDARRAARASADGEMVLLDEQDRGLWDRALIAEGTALVERAIASRRFGPYTLQAAIAAVHAEAPTAAATDWRQIAGLYDVLLRADPSPIVELNRAAAIAMHDGPAAGLALVDAILARGELTDYALAHAARADLCRRLGRADDARASYERALALTRQEPQRRFLERRIAALANGG